MTQFSQHRVLTHLRNLEEQVHFLEQYRHLGIEAFRRDQAIKYAVFHAFQIGIQNIMDVAAHIIASVFHESYDEYKQLISILGNHDVLPQDFVKRCSGIAEFRNKLVHGYLSVDPEKVHEYLATELPLLSEFAKHIVEFLERKHSDQKT